MEIKRLHPWKIKPQEASQIQEALKKRLLLENTLKPSEIKCIAAADVSYSKEENKVYAIVVCLSYPQLTILEEESCTLPATFPYIPGLLVFREGPPLIKAFENLKKEPDLIMFDAQGVAHPRGLGLASHMGVLLDKPSLGCAKSKLTGSYEEPRQRRGSTSPLIKDGQTIGMVVRTKDNVAPVFVSIGHKVDLPISVKLVLDSCRGYRLPEPLRIAHKLSTQVRASGPTQLSLGL